MAWSMGLSVRFLRLCDFPRLDNADTPDDSCGMTATIVEPLSPAMQDTGWVGFDDLPVEAQLAVQNWTTVHTPEYLTLCARLSHWQMVWIPTDIAIERVMSSGDHVTDFDGDWETYHDWYLSQGNIPDHGPSRWPVIEATIEARNADFGYLDDGWHRFHSYVAAGDTHIPLLRSRRIPD